MQLIDATWPPIPAAISTLLGAYGISREGVPTVPSEAAGMLAVVPPSPPKLIHTSAVFAMSVRIRACIGECFKPKPCSALTGQGTGMLSDVEGVAEVVTAMVFCCC